MPYYAISFCRKFTTSLHFSLFAQKTRYFFCNFHHTFLSYFCHIINCSIAENQTDSMKYFLSFLVFFPAVRHIGPFNRYRDEKSPSYNVKKHKGHGSVSLVLFPALLPVLLIAFRSLPRFFLPRADAARGFPLFALGGKRLLRPRTDSRPLHRLTGGALAALGVIRPRRPLAHRYRRAEPQPPPALQQERIQSPLSRSYNTAQNGSSKYTVTRQLTVRIEIPPLLVLRTENGQPKEAGYWRRFPVASGLPTGPCFYLCPFII